MFKSFKCYIQEYNNYSKACLIDCDTDKVIVFENASVENKNKLLLFLSGARNAGLDSFRKNGEDLINVSGDILKETNTEIFIAYNDNLSYFFE